MLFLRRCLALAISAMLLAALMGVNTGAVSAASAPPCYVTALNSGPNPYCPPDPASVLAAAGVTYLQPYAYTSVPYYPVRYVPYAYTGVPVVYSYPYAPYYWPYR